MLHRREGNQSRHLPDRCARRIPVQPSGKNILFLFFRSMWWISRHPAPMQGRYGQSSRNVGGVRWTRRCRVCRRSQGDVKLVSDQAKARETSGIAADGGVVWSWRPAIFGAWGKLKKPRQIKGFYELAARAAQLAKPRRALLGPSSTSSPLTLAHRNVLAISPSVLPRPSWRSLCAS